MATDAVDYLHGIKNSIINDVKAVALFHSKRDRRVSAGYFSTPREVFCYIDHLGYLAYGSLKNTERSLKFIKKYFSIIYFKYAELIHSMLRHGTVHEVAPSSFFVKRKGQIVKISWLCNNSNGEKNRKAHLKVFRLNREKNNLRITINTCQLVDDLIDAVDKLLQETQRNSKFNLRCSSRIDFVRKFKNPITKKRCSLKVKKRNKAVCEQIFLAQRKSCGDISASGEPL